MKGGAEAGLWAFQFAEVPGARSRKFLLSCLLPLGEKYKQAGPEGEDLVFAI